MALRTVGHEIDRRGGFAIDIDGGAVHMLAVPQTLQRFSPGVVTDAGEVSRVGAGTGRCNDGIAGVATKALQVVRLLRSRLVELHHRLAQCDNVKTLDRLCRQRGGGHRIHGMIIYRMMAATWIEPLPVGLPFGLMETSR